MKNPFQIKRTRKETNHEKENKKKLKEQRLEKAHHARIKTAISDIFKGKSKLTPSMKRKLMDHTFQTKIFSENDDINFKSLLDKKNSLDAHKLFSGQTRE